MYMYGQKLHLGLHVIVYKHVLEIFVKMEIVFIFVCVYFGNCSSPLKMFTCIVVYDHNFNMP